MKKLMTIILCLVLMTPVLSQAGRLRPEHDMEYLGAFRVPTDSSSNYTWGWVNQFSLTYNPVSGTLISPAMETGSNFGKVTEFSIPTPVKSKNLGDLPVSTTIHDWTDMTGGKWDIGLGEDSVAGMAYLPAQGTQTTPKLYWLTTSWYGAPGPYTNTTVPTLGMSDLNFSAPNSKGTWIITDVDDGPVSFTRTSLYLGNIPDAWSNAHAPGYKLFSGQHKINNGGALGPCFYAIKPWTTDTPPAAGETIDAKVLVCPGGDGDVAHRRNYNGAVFDDYSWVDSINDAVWVSVGTRSALIGAGSLGTLTAPGYGDCNAATEPCQYYKNILPFDADQVINPTIGCVDNVCGTSPDWESGGDVRGEPYYRVLWIYDPDDLADVIENRKQPYEPQPYVIFNLEKYMIYAGRSAPGHIGGIAYDSVNQKVYIAELKVDTTVSSYDHMPIIHVFQLSDSGAAADTLAPTAVSSVSNDGTGGLTWTAATDNDEVGGYLVKRNGKPIAFTATNSWNDTVYDRFIGTPNHTYTVESVDQANNSIQRGQTAWTGAGQRWKNFKIAESP